MAHGSTTWLARQLRLLRPGRSALARRWDRIEAVLAMIAIALCVAAVPMAMVIGSNVYDEQSGLARQHAAEIHQTMAITTVDAPEAPVTDTPMADQQVEVPALFTGKDGADRTEPVWVDPSTPKGSRIPIWVDRTDTVTIAPEDRSTMVGAAVSAGVFAGICGVAVAVGGLAAGRFLLNRRRAAGWAREWERISGWPSRS